MTKRKAKELILPATRNIGVRILNLLTLGGEEIGAQPFHLGQRTRSMLNQLALSKEVIDF